MSDSRNKNEPEIRFLRERLIERKHELESIRNSSLESGKTVDLDQSRVGRLSRMDALQGQAMSLEGERRRGLELTRIESALARIENDDFGCCLRCGEEIAPPRLAHDPSVTLCIQCASASERGQ